MSAQDVSGPAIERVESHLRKLFAADCLGQVFPGVPAPRVTLDLPGDEPEPLHVFVWGTARDFDAESFVTGAVMEASFHIWVTCIATASTSEDAAHVANAYQAMVVQMCLADPTLGGLCSDALSPVVKEADAWADADGRRHAGYLMDLGYTVNIQLSPKVAAMIKED